MDEETPFSLLTEQQRIFVQEYCTGDESGKKYNKTRAAEVAGYSQPNHDGSRLYRNPKIRTAIDFLFENNVMPKHEIIERLRDIAETDFSDLVVIVDGKPKLNMEAIEKVKHCIKNFGYDSNGNPKFEFHDNVAAIKDLARVRGLFKDGLELSGPDGGAVPLTLDVNFVEPVQSPE